MKKRGISPVLLLLLAMAAPPGAAESLVAMETLAELPQPVSNNALALVAGKQSFRVYSFLGLGPGKTRQDISRSAWIWDSSSGHWAKLADVPVKNGRLAATAVTAAGRVLLFGGYTVAADGHEASTPEVFGIREEGGFERLSNIPVPVDDSVALVYLDRYVYLVSGWHDVGNVNLVQVYDSVENSWQQAEPWPGEPVFGHAGGMLGRNMVLCDGVRIAYPVAAGPRQFLPSSECWLGEVNESDVRRIKWRQLEAHPGVPRYRMAATGAENHIVFIGGTGNPYNYDGIGYDGVAAEPIAEVFSYNFESHEWQCHGQAATATMDHRSLLAHDGWLYLAGGMLAGQKISNNFVRYRSPVEKKPCQE